MSTSWQPSDPDQQGSQQPQPWQSQQPEPQWTQPPFAPGYQAPAPLPPSSPYPGPPMPPNLPAPVSGPVLIPGGQIPPAGMLEASLRVISGLVWPVMIALVIFGNGSFVGAVIFAIIVSTLLKRITAQLRSRRIAEARVVPPTQSGPDLR